MNSTNFTTPISFGAQFIRKADVLRISADYKSYNPQQISFVEINPEDKHDVCAMNKVVKDWGYDTYVSEIYNDVKTMDYENSEKLHIYAITTQNKNFENLNPELVLGLTETTQVKKDIVKLEYIQVKPAYIYSYEAPLYKNIGTALLDCLKDLNRGKTIKLNSVPTAVNFYKKNDFKEIAPNCRQFEWNG